MVGKSLKKLKRGGSVKFFVGVSMDIHLVLKKRCKERKTSLTKKLPHPKTDFVERKNDFDEFYKQNMKHS